MVPRKPLKLSVFAPLLLSKHIIGRLKLGEDPRCLVATRSPLLIRNCRLTRLPAVGFRQQPREHSQSFPTESFILDRYVRNDSESPPVTDPDNHRCARLKLAG